MAPNGNEKSRRDPNTSNGWRARNIMPLDARDDVENPHRQSHTWRYPELAKLDSDGTYCYHVQRRFSGWISVRLARWISPNMATGIDLLVGLAACWSALSGHWLRSAVLIQAFGLFSCIDGEIARIQDRSSRIGDYLDTLTDRVVEILFILAITWSLSGMIDEAQALSSGLALSAGVLLLTTSSEKFRSTYRMSYPKRRLEPLFATVCAGSDSRLLLLSLGLIVAGTAGEPRYLLWLIWCLAIATGTNFVVRMGLIVRHFSDEDAHVSK